MALLVLSFNHWKKIHATLNSSGIKVKIKIKGNGKSKGRDCLVLIQA